MRIGIDARMLGPQCGGLGRYIEQLVLQIEAQATSHEYVLFFNKENWQCYTAQTNRIRKVLADIPWYGLREHAEFPGVIAREHVDLMHFPHWNVPVTYRGPYVVTIHDLIMWHFPRGEASTHGPVAYFFKDRIGHLVLRRAAKRAAHIITTSEFTKQDIHETLGVPMGKMSVTYQAPFVMKTAESHIPHVDVLKKFGITKPYVLYVGVAYPHKNLERLVDAWKIFEEKFGADFQLVLAGKENFFYRKLGQKIAVSECQNIVSTGFVEDDVLDALYRGASLYIAPSLYEGFALPALEAMARGVPVAASNRSCFPEVLGEAALYFNPENIEQIAVVMHQALSDNNIRLELVERGKEEIHRYAWKVLAQKTVQIYEQASVGREKRL